MKIDFYCWNKCTTCRKAKALLLERDVAFNERDFFKEPFTRNEITALLEGRSARDIFSFRSPSAKALPDDPQTLSDDALIDLMLSEPRLIRRPIVKIKSQVHFGADGKKLLELLP